jgi:dipeptidyl aminopeptidase/acylaminoacyl peptidase
MFRRFVLAAAAVLLLPAAAPPADPAAAFGEREAIQDISLSPAGTKIAFITPGPGQSTVLYTADIGSTAPPQRAAFADGKPERLSSCGWVSEQRLVCTIYIVTDRAGVAAGTPIGATRLIALDSNGGNIKLLSRPTRPDDLYVSFSGGGIIDWLPGSDGAVMMTREYVPEGKIGTRLEDKREGLGVDRIDTASLSSKSVEMPRRQASGFVTDGRGKVRLMATREIAGATGYATGRTKWYYRKQSGGDWLDLGEYDAVSETGIWPVAVDPALDVAYIVRDHQGRVALFSVALDGSKRETLVFAHPEVDVDGPVRIGRSQRVVGVTYAVERREAAYFDKELASLSRALAKALPGLPLIRFLDATADESKLLLWAGSDTDPGRYYLFDKASKRLSELMLARPQLESAQLAPMKAVKYRAADGTEVPAYLTLPVGSAGRNLPAIVMPHGGPSARDEWGFDWLAQFYAARGYAVLQPNYRGSAGYGAAWYQQNGFKSWKTAIGDVNDAGRWLVAQGIADPARLAIVGWSYGGYAALQANVLDPKLFKAVVAVAPVTDLPELIEDSRLWSSHRVNRKFIGDGPHLREGSPAHNAARIEAPVLIFHGDLDLNVSVEQARIMHSRLKDAGKRSELVVYPGLDHGLDDEAARTELLRKSDAFLRASMGIK